jgi:hypothetical protein
MFCNVIQILSTRCHEDIVVFATLGDSCPLGFALSVQPHKDLNYQVKRAFRYFGNGFNQGGSRDGNDFSSLFE